MWSDSKHVVSSDAIRRHSRSFSFASRLLPVGVRTDVHHLYAWCRWCDDGVDAATSPCDAETFVERAAADLDRIAAGITPEAVESRWLDSLVRRHDLSLPAANALLAGMRSDLIPAAGWSVDDLLRYCFRVAGAVGVLMCPLLGLRDKRYVSHAAALGMGMQMTNIARDVAEDWQRCRCYLPVEWTAGLFPDGADPDREAVRRGVRELLTMADGFYTAGESGLVALNAKCRLAVRAAAKIYHAIGNRIRQQNYEVVERRAYVSTTGKVGLFAVSLLANVFGSTAGPLPTEAARALTVAEGFIHEHGVFS